MSKIVILAVTVFMFSLASHPGWHQDHKELFNKAVELNE